jgi:hypothetical protein
MDSKMFRYMIMRLFGFLKSSCSSYGALPATRSISALTEGLAVRFIIPVVQYG